MEVGVSDEMMSGGRRLKEEVLTLGNLSKPSFQEVQQWILPEGVCQHMGCLRVRPEPFDKVISQDNLRARATGVTGIVDNAERSSLEIKPILAQLLQNDRFLEMINTLALPGATIPQEVIKNSLMIFDRNLIDRVFYIVNSNIDPEFTPLAISRVSGDLIDRSNPFFSMLCADKALRFRFASLLSHPKYSRELYDRHYKDERPYSPEFTADINGLVSQCIYQLHQLNPSVTAEEISDLKKYSEHFFNIDTHTGGSRAPVTELLKQLIRLTASAYFEKRFPKDSEGNENWGLVYMAGETPQGYIREHARAVEAAKYLLNLYRLVLGVYKQYFPEVYVEPAIEKIKLRSPRSSYLGICEDSGGFYDDSERSVGIISGTIMQSSGRAAFNEETMSFNELRVRRKVNDAVVTAHELAHGIYEKLVGSKREVPKPAEYKITADHAINEGFAVMMELMFIKTMIAHPEILGCDSRDLKDLQAFRGERLKRLKREGNGYTEGTYRILNRVYGGGPGHLPGHNIQSGLAAIRNFLEGLDINKTLRIRRDGVEYGNLLREGDANRWKQLFSS